MPGFPTNVAFTIERLLFCSKIDQRKKKLVKKHLLPANRNREQGTPRKTGSCGIVVFSVKVKLFLISSMHPEVV